MSRYSHVVFDLDGTIYDSNHANLQSLHDALSIVCPQKAIAYEELSRFAARSAKSVFDELEISSCTREPLLRAWCKRCFKYQNEVKPFNHVIEVISFLKHKGIKQGIATSRDSVTDEFLPDDLKAFPIGLKQYIDTALCARDVKNAKPAPDILKKYLKISGADPKEVLFVGDTAEDLACARAAGVDFALAMWGYTGRCSLRPDWFLTTPWDLAAVVFSHKDEDAMWFSWAREIQAIGQIGLAYSKDIFDIERFTRLREIACEMTALMTLTPKEKVREAFSFDKGYACPKVDTRAAVFDQKGRILLVKEKISGKWNLPGGWCDDTETVVSNTLKELREEACMEGMPLKLIAVLDRNRHNTPKFTFGVVKVFIECAPSAFSFTPTDETSECAFFAYEDLPLEQLRLGTTTVEQLELCFSAHRDDHWVPILE